MRVEISVRAQATENSILGIEGVSYEPVQNKLTVISLVTNAQDYYPLEFMEHEKPHLFCTKISIDIAKMNTLPKSIERIIVSDQQSLAEAKERAVGLYYDLHDYQTQKQLALVDFGSIEETKNLAQINVKKIETSEPFVLARFDVGVLEKPKQIPCTLATFGLFALGATVVAADYVIKRSFSRT